MEVCLSTLHHLAVVIILFGRVGTTPSAGAVGARMHLGRTDNIVTRNAATALVIQLGSHLGLRGADGIILTGRDILSRREGAHISLRLLSRLDFALVDRWGLIMLCIELLHKLGVARVLSIA